MIRKLLRKLAGFSKTALFQTSLWNGLATLIKIATGLITNKIVAVYLGPSGIAILGQFGNFTSIANSIANFGITNGITKYIAQFGDDMQERIRFQSTGLRITLGATFLTTVTIIAGARYFCTVILQDAAYLPLFYIFSATLFLFSLNAFLISVLNGYKEFRKIILINIISSLLGLLITVALVIYFGLWGALTGMILSTTLIAAVSFLFVLNARWFSFSNFMRPFDPAVLKKLLHYSLMAFTSLFAVSWIQLMTRTYIINHLSVDEAGYWQGIVKISDIYLLLITSTLSIYYLPRLSEIKDSKELLREVMQSFLFVIPLTIALSAGIYLFRAAIIRIIFSESFVPMDPLFLPQLIGNVLKIATWLLGIITIARSMTLVYISFEIVGGVVFYVLTIWFIRQFGLIGATYSYTFTYFLYFTAFLVLMPKLVRSYDERDIQKSGPQA